MFVQTSDAHPGLDAVHTLQMGVSAKTGSLSHRENIERILEKGKKNTCNLKRIFNWIKSTLNCALVNFN